PCNKIRAALAADTETLTLADRVVHQAVVLPFVFTGIHLYHTSRVCRKVAAQEFLEVPFTDEAYACGIFLVLRRQVIFLCKLPYFRFVQMAEREHDFR